MQLCSSDPPLLHASSLTDDNQVIYAQYLHEVFSNVLFFQTCLVRLRHANYLEFPSSVLGVTRMQSSVSLVPRPSRAWERG